MLTFIYLCMDACMYASTYLSLYLSIYVALYLYLQHLREIPTNDGRKEPRKTASHANHLSLICLTLSLQLSRRQHHNVYLCIHPSIHLPRPSSLYRRREGICTSGGSFIISCTITPNRQCYVKDNAAPRRGELIRLKKPVYTASSSSIAHHSFFPCTLDSAEKHCHCLTPSFWSLSTGRKQVKRKEREVLYLSFSSLLLLSSWTRNENKTKTQEERRGGRRRGRRKRRRVMIMQWWEAEGGYSSRGDRQWKEGKDMKIDR